jgi:hypothetical protein
MFTSSKRLVPEKLKVSGTYYQDSDVSKRYQKNRKVKCKKKQKKEKNKKNVILFIEIGILFFNNLKHFEMKAVFS